MKGTSFNYLLPLLKHIHAPTDTAAAFDVCSSNGNNDNNNVAEYYMYTYSLTLISKHAYLYAHMQNRT